MRAIGVPLVSPGSKLVLRRSELRKAPTRSTFTRCQGEKEGSDSRDDNLVVPLPSPDSDWREFRAKLVERHRSKSLVDEAPAPSAEIRGDEGKASETYWAHSIAGPEKGCVLLAHPGMFQERQQYFHMAVILILEHNELGSYGIILNRPSVHTMGSLQLSQPLDEFAECPLLLGGDVGGSDVHMLHPYGHLAGSVKVVKGIYVGGLDAARRAVAQGEAKATDFRWFAKYAGWGPQQLERECRLGAWFTAAASSSAILRQAGDNVGPAAWHNVLNLMGDDFQELSMNVRAQEERAKRWMSEEGGEETR